MAAGTIVEAAQAAAENQNFTRLAPRDTGEVDGWQYSNGEGVVELAGILIFEFIIAAVLLIVAVIVSIRIVRFVLWLIVAIIAGFAGMLTGALRRRVERSRSRQAERLLRKQRLSGGVARIDPHFDPDFRRRSPE